MIDLGVFDIKNQSLSINKLKEILKNIKINKQLQLNITAKTIHQN